MREALQRVEPELSAPTNSGDGHVAPPPLPDGLSQREAEVLALLADGLTSREIAQRLVVTVATVSRHIANTYTKIDARGRADATRYAIAHGITSDKLTAPKPNGTSQPAHSVESSGGRVVRREA